MISVIICSKSSEALEKVKVNIETTIGVPSEIISIANPDGQIGICKAYNEAAAQASHELVCFVHEDVAFETVNWGQKLIRHFQNSALGLLGIAGGNTKSMVPSSWSPLIFKGDMNIIQHFKAIDKEPQHIRFSNTPLGASQRQRVVCVDGVFMAVRKEVLTGFRFDEKNFPGFHGYDIDFSIQVGQVYEVAVAFDISMHHFSDGSFDKQWLRSAMAVSAKWRYLLPLSTLNLSEAEFVRQHWTSMGVFINKMYELNFSTGAILANFLKYAFSSHFHLMHFLHFSKLILNRSFIPAKTQQRTSTGTLQPQL